MKIATWNINSIRLREQLVTRLLSEEQPDILCLQEATDVFKFKDLTSWNTQKYVRRRMIWNIRGDFGAEVIGSSGSGYAALR